MITIVNHGIYSIPEVSRYTRLNPSRVRAWFRPRCGSTNKPVLHADYSADNGKDVVSFHDLIDVLVVGQLRRFGVAMPAIRDAYRVLQGELQARHPFSSGKLATDGRRVFKSVAQDVADPQLIEVVSKQQFMHHVMLEYLQFIEYDELTEMARLWHIAERVVIDPRICLGKPVIQGTSVTTNAVLTSYRANDRDVDLVADVLNIGPDDVLDAVAFEEQLRRKAA